MQADILPETANAPIRRSALLLEAATLAIDHLEDGEKGRRLLDESVHAATVPAARSRGVQRRVEGQLCLSIRGEWSPHVLPHRSQVDLIILI